MPLMGFELFHALQVAARTDSLAGDSVVVKSPLPGGPAAVVRFLFTTVPQWVQIAGVFIGAAVAILLLAVAWRRRTQITAWFGARSRGWVLGFAAIVLVALGGVGFAGFKSWHFMMHDNGFCTGCHVMTTSFERFTTSEHSKLQCHDCHRQGMAANMRQMYQWVSERPDKIGVHAPVPNERCNECHVQRDADSTWKRISATAGHQMHLNPRSPAVKDLSCVACHGQEVHRFKSNTATCAQSGCHDKLRIELGKMAAQSSLHCTMCHQFSATAVEGNPVDSARSALVPRQDQCLQCHQMQARMKTFRPESDPHNGECGLCHNPHTQTTTFGAYQSCATSQCHSSADTLTAMHRGLGDHTLNNCGACHVAHTWKVKATNCRGCHTETDLDRLRTLRGKRRISDAGSVVPRGLANPVRATDWLGFPGVVGASGATVTLTPASLARADHQPRRAGSHRWRESAAPPPATRITLHRARSSRPTLIQPVAWRAIPSARPPGGAPREAGNSRPRLPPAALPQQDTTKFSHRIHRSLECTTCHGTQESHGAVKPSARQCASCHHADNALGRNCERCHQTAALAAPRTVSLEMKLTVWPAPRARPLSFSHQRHDRFECANCHAMNTARSVEKTCTSCHENHHQVTTTCTACHQPARATHTRAVHVTGCTQGGCHAAETTPATSDARAVCLLCHSEQRDHKAGRECATCHLTKWTAGPTRGGGAHAP